MSEWIVIVQLIMGGSLVGTMEKGFATEYECHYEEVLMREGMHGIQNDFAAKGLTDYEIIPRCYQRNTSKKDRLDSHGP
jgi:hypothetical protein